jgi:hypothetical protein
MQSTRPFGSRTAGARGAPNRWPESSAGKSGPAAQRPASAGSGGVPAGTNGEHPAVGHQHGRAGKHVLGGLQDDIAVGGCVSGVHLGGGGWDVLLGEGVHLRFDAEDGAIGEQRPRLIPARVVLGPSEIPPVIGRVVDSRAGVIDRAHDEPAVGQDVGRPGLLPVTRHEHAASLIVSIAGTVILWLPATTL